MAHKEISPVIPLTSVVDHFLWCHDTAQGCQGTSPISASENEDAIITIALVAMSLEGYLNRILFLLEDEDVRTIATSSCSARFEQTAEKKLAAILPAKSDQNLIAGVDELLTARNSLAHSHIYETDRDDGRNISKTDLRMARNDPRWKRCVDPATFRTKTRQLNVVPSEVDFSDALTALELWGDVHSALTENLGDRHAYLPSTYPAHYRTDLATQKKIDGLYAIHPSLRGYVLYGQGI